MYENIKLIAEKYYGKAAIRIFPYISPELYANDQKHYLTELDLENSIGITTNNIEEIAGNLYRKLNDSYFPNPCQDKQCDWYEDCRIIKWLWLYTHDNQNLTVDQKLKDFCNMKKAINTGLFEGIMKNQKDT